MASEDDHVGATFAFLAALGADDAGDGGLHPGTLSATHACSAVTLNIAFADVGSPAQVRLTVNSLADPADTSSVTRTFTASSAMAGSTAAIAAAATQTPAFTSPVAPSTSGIPRATLDLDSTGSPRGGGVTYSCSLRSQPGTAIGGHLATLSRPSAVTSATTACRSTGSSRVRRRESGRLPFE